MVGRYNAEGNRPTATPELLRCNDKVIRRRSRSVVPVGAGERHRVGSGLQRS